MLRKNAHVFNSLDRSKHHKVHTNFNFPLVPRQVKVRKVPIHIQDTVASEIKIKMEQSHIEKLDKGTTDNFIAPIVLTAKTDGSIKLALNAKPMKAQIWKNKYQMPNIHEPIDSVAQIITKDEPGKVSFTSLDLITLSVCCRCHLLMVVIRVSRAGVLLGRIDSKPFFFGLTDMPTESRKATDCTLRGLDGAICYLDDILIVTQGDIQGA